MALVAAALFVWIGVGPLGCGVKAPPVPLRAPPVPTATDLTYLLEADQVVLRWRLSEALTVDQARSAAFGIYQSRTDLDEPECNGCPLVFERAATVAYVAPVGGGYSTRLPIAPGHRYAFRVRLETAGRQGADSNTVAFALQRSSGNNLPSEAP